MTGSAGFIGYHVCRLLLESNETVEGVDNLDDAYDVRLKEWRLRQLSIWPNFRSSEFDISDYRAVRPLFATDSAGGPSQISAVINLGARAGVRSSLDDPWAYYQTNAIGTLNLLELCREFEVKKFVLASSSSVYGAETSRPFVEEGHTSRPLSPYGASKKAAETLVYSYHYLYGIDATVLRYFTVYGPAGRPDMGPFIFIRAISEGAPITVFGDGKQERDFTYVDDVARGTIDALRPLGYEIINLGGNRPVVLTHFIEIIEESLGKKAQIEYAPAHSADVKATWADIHRAERLLDWRPKISIEEGIKRTVQWYTDNREWAREIR